MVLVTVHHLLAQKGVGVSTLVLVVAMEDIISSSRQMFCDVFGSYKSVKLRLGDSCVFIKKIKNCERPRNTRQYMTRPRPFVRD